MNFFWLVCSLGHAKDGLESDVMVSVGIMDRTRVSVTINIKETLGFFHHLFYIVFSVV